ncbi:hypothetical protein HPB50_002239 [Hyalomma asiaticum]|uniref:Uncharacterized protein n=1 Tax=Hyalomma asiaticum TaxID=266040 RepID=A0ACB7TCZ2_HYAAI|nr:hypothetical protein HPB50_002239 [Hyalomma asiaticum]
MKGQKKRVRPASAGACRNSRGTPPYSTQRQQHAEPQQDNTEASPTVFESGSLLFVAELFVEGYLIEESLTPLSTGYTAANYAAPTTTSVVGPQIWSYYRIYQTPSSPRRRWQTGLPRQRRPRLSCPPKGRNRQRHYVENEVPLTADTAAAGVSAAAAKSEVRDPPQDVPLPSCQNLTPQEDLTLQAPPQLLTTQSQRQQQPLAAAQQDGNSPEKWTVEEVARFIAGVPGCERYAERFRDRKIEGDALFQMKEDHLMVAINMELGPALKLCAAIDSLREVP